MSEPRRSQSLPGKQAVCDERRESPCWLSKSSPASSKARFCWWRPRSQGLERRGDRGESVHGHSNNYAHTGKTLSNGTWPTKTAPGGGCCLNANQAVASDCNSRFTASWWWSCRRSLWRTTWRSSLSTSSSTAAYRSEWALSAKQIVAFDVDVAFSTLALFLLLLFLYCQQVP